MTGKNPYNAKFPFFSVRLIIILLFGLGISVTSVPGPSAIGHKHVPSEISLHQDNATITTGIQLQSLQRSWISNKDNFKLPPFEAIQYFCNKKSEQKIILLDEIHKDFFSLVISYRQFPRFHCERNDLPGLG